MIILYKGDKKWNLKNLNQKIINVKFTLRLPEEMHQELSIYSNKHNISMNTLILNCIEYAMSNKED